MTEDMSKPFALSLFHRANDTAIFHDYSKLLLCTVTLHIAFAFSNILGLLLKPTHQLVVCTTCCCYFLAVLIDEQVLDNMNFIYYSDIDFTCIA